MDSSEEKKEPLKENDNILRAKKKYEEAKKRRDELYEEHNGKPREEKNKPITKDAAILMLMKQTDQIHELRERINKLVEKTNETLKPKEPSTSQAMNHIGKVINGLTEKVNNPTEEKNEYPQKIYDLLTDAEFREYLRLTHESIEGDFDAFCRDFTENVGSKFNNYLYLLYVVGSYKE